MKKNVKKVENKGIDSTELIMALDELEKERGIKKDYVIESIETALVTAYKRNFDVTSDNVKITLNRETGETHVYEELNVVNEVEDWDTQISVEDAKKNLIEVPMVGTTIPHEVTSVFGGARVLLKPAIEGAGVAAGGAVRAVVELAGIADVTSKSLGSNTPINIVRATVNGLAQLKRADEVAALRGISVSDLA